MTLEHISSDQMGESLKNWYQAIMEYDFENAAVLKNKVELSMPNFLDNKKISSFYNLLLLRYGIMSENLKKGDIRPITIDAENDLTIGFYFHFFSGQTYYQHKNYSIAMRHYNLAESFLPSIQNFDEHAEFHYHLGQLFYKIVQYDTALYHLEKAKEIFKLKSVFKEKEVSCNLLLAAIASEKGDLYKSDTIYLDALNIAKENNFDWTSGLILRGMAFNYNRLKEYTKAKKSLRDALEFNEFKDSNVGKKAKIELAHVLFKENENLKKAESLLHEGWKHVEDQGDSEYIGKAKIIFNTYVDYDENEILSSMKRLLDSKYNFQVNELSMELVDIMKKRKDYDKASKYYEFALDASSNIIKGEF